MYVRTKANMSLEAFEICLVDSPLVCNKAGSISSRCGSHSAGGVDDHQQIVAAVTNAMGVTEDSQSHEPKESCA